MIIIIFFFACRAIGAVAVVVPTSLWFLNRGHDGVKHNDHDAQKGLHTRLTAVEKSKYPAGRVGGTLQGIDEVVVTRPEDVESHLPRDALNHPVNREKVSFEKTPAQGSGLPSSPEQASADVGSCRSRRRCS